MSDEKQTYTDSAANDRIKSYFLGKPDQIAIIEHLGATCKGSFLFNPSEATQEIQDIFLQSPEDFRFIVRRALSELVAEWFDDNRAVAVANHVKVIITTSTTIKCNTWSSKHHGIPVATNCQIVGSLKEETYTKFAECVCSKCHEVMEMKGNEMPIICGDETCSSRKFFVKQESVIKGDIKTVIIQEPMDEVKHGSPKLFSVVLKDDLIFDAFPGQRKILTGVFTSTPKKNSRDRNSIFINAISMQNIDDENVKMPTPEKIMQFEELAKKINYLDIITDSFAPEIKFRKMEKMALIISRVGSKKVGRIRGNIPTLLIGAPGTAKSKMLEFLPLVTQRCGFATGGMATGAGITVTMTTLPDKTKFPKGGIVVQSSGSLVVLDELNQFPDEDIAKTYTCMESGKIPYNKGGFDQVFIADTTICAGANPKNGYYIPSLGMVKNINLPAPMISRFDIIINVKAEKSLTESQQITDHTYMIKDIGVEQYIKNNNLLTPDEMLELFNYCNSLSVKITEEAKKIIDDYVRIMMQLQNSGDQVEGSKQFDRRFIESVLRISEAITKLHLQTVMTKEFAVMAIDYIKATLDTFDVKTENGETTIPLDKLDQKDKSLAFDKEWMLMVKQSESQLLPEFDFIKSLASHYPKLFPTTDKAAKYFNERHEKGDLIYENGRYRMVK